MSTTPGAMGTLDVAVAHAARLLESRPDLAAEQASEILKSDPQHTLATLLLGVARRRSGDAGAALQVLHPLAALHPQWALAQLELALAYGEHEQTAESLAALRRALALKPDMADAWRALGDQLTIAGDAAGADAAYAQNIRASTKDPRLLKAAAALCENRIPEAELLLRTHLEKYTTDVAALRMLAEVAARLQRFADAESLLARCVELAPSFTAARHQHAIVLHRQNQSAAAMQEVDELLANDPRNPAYNNLKAAILARIGELDESIEIYASILAQHPAQPKIWMSFGHALKTKGHEQKAVAAYKQSIELQPSLGEAYWSLANLKTTHFAESDMASMRAQLANPKITDENRFHLNFALGKALEDRGEYAASFEQYALGNGLRKSQISYNAEDMSRHVARVKALCTATFFADRASHGAAAPDPIFIIGLPRSGSTLLEQILSSHSQVEGTMELPDIPLIAKTLSKLAKQSDVGGYTAVLATLGAAECAELGERYLSQTRIQRKTVAPFFIDKLPNNFAHIDLIHLALPHAKIIDARRHPLGCGFSAFKQHFARGQSFTYSLEDIGRYYRDYVELTAHFDAMLPGRIHRVIYESMIENTEREVRRLLDYCGLPFEGSCLRFYENERAVRTASSQQVRKPIFQEGIDHWRHYEPWLAPLKHSLGSVLETYPQAPQF